MIQHITYATVITIVRILLIPWIVFSLVSKLWLSALLLLSVAALSDLFDGIIARRYGQESALGACLDPIADKLLIITSYVSLLCADHNIIQIPIWFIILLLVREIIILAGGWYLGIARHIMVIRPTLLGKITTCVQLIFIIMLVLSHIFEIRFIIAYEILFILACLFLVASLIQYIWLALQGIIVCRVRNM